MTWDKENNLFCNWCGKTTIPANKVTEHDKEFNIGWTKCSDCVKKAIPFPKEGKISELPEDYNPKILGRIIIESFNPIESVFILDRAHNGLCPYCGSSISHCKKCGKKYL
jgi:hypothetical protein